MEDLQTDVMRFMAILAFCLVAIFALVQSIPLRPEPPPAQKDLQRQSLTPTPVAEPEQPPARPAQRPAARESAPPRKAAPRPAAQAPKAPERTFTLRFASDAALRRLVSTGQVQLYALGTQQVWRLSAQPHGLVFEPAAAPHQVHLMREETVPRSLLPALRRTASAGDQVSWGVTLPASTTEAIARHLRSPVGGTLVIEASGDVRREDPEKPNTVSKP